MKEGLQNNHERNRAPTAPRASSGSQEKEESEKDFNKEVSQADDKKGRQEVRSCQGRCNSSKESGTARSQCPCGPGCAESGRALFAWNGEHEQPLETC